MTARYKTLLAFSVALLCGAGIRANLPTGQNRQKVGLAGATVPQTGWFQRPPEAGDYQIAIPFPNIERPPALAKYWPMNRDLPAGCNALTQAYNDAMADAEAELAKLEKRKLSDADPET